MSLFPNIRGTSLKFPRIRIIVSRGLYGGLVFWETTIWEYAAPPEFRFARLGQATRSNGAQGYLHFPVRKGRQRRDFGPTG